jgi:hypothetical protein
MGREKKDDDSTGFTGKRNKSFREMDAARGKSKYHSRQDDPNQQRIERSASYEKYKKAADSLFSGGALPEGLAATFDPEGKRKEQKTALKKVTEAEDRKQWAERAVEYIEKYDLPDDAFFLDSLLDRLATYKEKILAIKGKIKSALFYPVSIIVVAFVITAVIMIFVIPSFKQVFASFGAELPAPTLIVMSISDFFVTYWWAIFGAVGGALYALGAAYRKSEAMRNGMDRLMLKVPVFGEIIQKASIARWARTLSTMFAAGVPLVEALGSVAGAAGNAVYMQATKRIQQEISTGTSLTVSMQGVDVFPSMVLQMVAIGEESGALDSMLSKVADFYEAEVDDAVDAMSSLMEPIIMVVLGTLIGGMVIAMYLPIFKMGQVV